MSPESRKSRIVATSAIFLIALVMGPGPGSLLVGAHGAEPKVAFGVPALYLWLVVWFFVMAGCVLYAATKLWRDES